MIFAWCILIRILAQLQFVVFDQNLCNNSGGVSVICIKKSIMRGTRAAVPRVPFGSFQLQLSGIWLDCSDGYKVRFRFKKRELKLYSFITTNSVVYHAVLCAMISWKRHKVKQKTNKQNKNIRGQTDCPRGIYVLVFTDGFFCRL